MGIDAIALLDHQLKGASFDDFPNHVDWSLVSNLSPFSRLRATASEPGGPSWAWDLPLGARSPYAEMLLHGEVSVSSGSTTVRLWHSVVRVHGPCRWSVFVCDPEEQRVYQRACRALAPALGSTLAVYLPDACDDRDDDTSLAEFVRKLGAPAGSLEELFDRELAERTGSSDGAVRFWHYVERIGE